MLNQIVKIVDHRKRVGRGGKRGGTSGRGHKGQKARTSGTVGPVFEGGQMPLVRRLPKRGFSNERFARSVEIVNIGSLEHKYLAGETVDKESLKDKGLIKGKRGWGIKILGNGVLSKALIVSVDFVSESAKQAIESCKGTVQSLVKES